MHHNMHHCPTGLYTSPHLFAVQEQIRISSVPLSEADFALYFFQVWDRLQANTEVNLQSPIFVID